MKQAIERITAINKTLLDKGYGHEGVEDFWNGIFLIAERVEKGHIDWTDITVCTGCGKLNIEKRPPEKMACCHVLDYIPVFPVPIQNI